MAEKNFRQLVLMGKGGPWAIQEKPVPKAGVGQLVVKMDACSICNQTDLNTIKALHMPHDHQIEGMLPHHFRQWDHRQDALTKYLPTRPYDLAPFPTTMGHEGTGVVVDVGAMPDPVYPLGATHGGSAKMNGFGGGPDFKVGDRVAMVGTVGGFGEYIVSPVHEAVKVPDHVDAETASLFEPTMLTNAIVRQTVRMDDIVVILGQGALGLLCTRLAKIYGARLVIVTEPVPMKREVAKKMGADVVIDPYAENVADHVAALTGYQGADVVIEAAGEQDSIALVPYVARSGAKVGQVGACCLPVISDWCYIHFKGLEIHSTNDSIQAMGGLEPAKERAMLMMASGRIDYAPLITHRLPMTVEATNKIFAEIEEGNTVIKAIYKF